MRWFAGCYERYGAQRWRLTTTYYDGSVVDNVFHWFLRWTFEICVVEEIEDTTEIITANVPGEDALSVARLGWKYKGPPVATWNCGGSLTLGPNEKIRDAYFR